MNQKKSKKTLSICVHCAFLPNCRFYDKPATALEECPKITDLGSVEGRPYLSEALKPFNLPSEYPVEIRNALNNFKRIAAYPTVRHAMFDEWAYTSILN